jgi:ribosomal 30S subunit maturation factor RimM
MENKEKIKELIEKRDRTKKKLEELVSKFRGVRHEDAAGELADMQIKIQQAHLESLEAEIADLEKEEK